MCILQLGANFFFSVRRTRIENNQDTLYSLYLPNIYSWYIGIRLWFMVYV